MAVECVEKKKHKILVSFFVFYELFDCEIYWEFQENVQNVLKKWGIVICVRIVSQIYFKVSKYTAELHDKSVWGEL